MSAATTDTSPISPWWRQAVILVMILGFTLLTIVTVKTYNGAPPIPSQVVDARGGVVFTEADVNQGQEVFLKYGLMEHGTLWGHGAYLGPDYTAEYLHRLAEIAQDTEATRLFGKSFAELSPGQAGEVARFRQGAPQAEPLRRRQPDPHLHGCGKGLFRTPERANGNPISQEPRPRPVSRQIH